MRRIAVGLEIFIQIVIFYSLIMYFVEIEFGGTKNALAGHPFFLWSERTVALIFTVEYLVRWATARPKWSYPFRPLAIVDLLAVLPFYFGFLVDMRLLRLVRTLRILRLFKLFRYNEALKSFGRSCGKVKHELHMLGVAVVFLIFFSGTIMYEAERTAQPEMFGKYSDGIWWSVVSLTTVGYGDKYPITLVGRLTACVSLFLGLGLFGSFVSLIGGAFASTLNENRDPDQRIRLSVDTSRRLVRILRAAHCPVGEQDIDRLIQQALDGLDGQPAKPLGEDPSPFPEAK